MVTRAEGWGKWGDLVKGHKLSLMSKFWRSNVMYSMVTVANNTVLYT